MTGLVNADVVEALARGGADAQCRILDERSAEVADVMANGFTRRYPEMAAKPGFARWQLAVLAMIVAGGLAGVVFAPLVVLAVLTVLATVYSLLNLVVMVAGSLSGGRRGAGGDPPVPDVDLPRYTVLVPAYREAEVIGGLVRQLAGLDYPPDRLEVLILVERHDPDTARAVRSADPPAFVRIVELPPGPPQTKPRSVNLGLLLARGELLVIFDAEDRPEPDQLRRAAARFAARDGRLACVQARLLYHNAGANWLTRQFAFEYALRFGLALPGLARLGMPVPLGGSSNHFRTEALRRLGGWDAWNVTEDADLGMRCACLGYRVEMIGSVTWEEAVDTIGPFVRQRTRWFKGFLMTTMVHTRLPWQALRRFRARGILTLLGIVASAPVTALAQPLMAALTVLAVSGSMWSSSGAGLLVPAVTLQAVSAATWIGITFVAARRSGLAAPWQAVFTPCYAVLWWIAAWRAVFQLAFSPFSWEKTPHRNRPEQA
ncbi:Glycosyltransferase, catalytic subunit of cellulose synthase and poly-beta-1,6-N-acetylglucosamine synthase [Amycolatopsis xylanica]|uniref:Glycosyltransferase, catalytic subunit of cellulose synthase and poly-beta-1,6-N-acetylglucosamine synthase n=1 Tax=Amycolatopsis xylanica TaxID=589385 RepID=A0A1H3SE99_9PSEU|nr:glycosyltransferase family 2 protein [Amycolatopsis xylanica]SDZ36057.1 Glycosyltransferase, catalytic subunit of cellulose synthase and poly-beta-1,6-N-acetylglucosamine synthase [Amycolatopsis xylanica]